MSMLQMNAELSHLTCYRKLVCFSRVVMVSGIMIQTIQSGEFIWWVMERQLKTWSSLCVISRPTHNLQCCKYSRWTILNMKACRTTICGISSSTKRGNRIDSLEDKLSATKHPRVESPDKCSDLPHSGLYSPPSNVNFDCSIEMDLDDNFCNYDT